MFKVWLFRCRGAAECATSSLLCRSCPPPTVLDNIKFSVHRAVNMDDCDELMPEGLNMVKGVCPGWLNRVKVVIDFEDFCSPQ